MSRPSPRSLVLVLALAAGCAATARTPVANTAPAGPSLVEVATDATPKLDTAVQSALAKHVHAGATVVVLHHGKAVLTRGYGFADVEAKRAAAADTRYRIGSITKSFTAAAILRLVRAGKVRLDDAVTKYVRDFPKPEAGITIRQLLQHTSGVRNYTELPRFRDAPAKPMTRAEMVTLFGTEPLDFPPGSEWRYSNSGYYLLGLVIEAASGRPYAEYVHDELVAPLGLAATAYCLPEQTGPHDAHGYTTKDGALVAADPLDMAHPYAAGSLCSSSTDLARWLRALADHTAVTANEWNLMTTPATLTGGKSFPYGLGLASNKLAGHEYIGHNGGISGFGSTMMWFPNDELLVVAMINSDDLSARELAEAAVRVALDIPADPPVKDQPITAAEAAVYQGVYDFPLIKLRIKVAYKDGHLATANIQPDGKDGELRPLRWQGGHGFLFPEVDADFAFTVEGGKVTSLRVVQRGMTFDAGPPAPLP